MCGIYGRIGCRNDELDQRALLTLRHRGPDDIGLFVDPHSMQTSDAVILGHTRLSILDLSSAGHQPMCTEDDQLVITYNGEIYNYLELRAELVERGYQFRSNTDTEVLLKLYREFGDAMLDKIAGMYAFAILDRRQRRLLLARDPSGIKPLFYRTKCSTNTSIDTLAFASEIKALLVDPRFERRPNLYALIGYLSYLYTPPPETAFEDIQCLLPGHKLVFQNQEIKVSRQHYYQATPKHDFAGINAATDTLEKLLLEVVRQHMLSDVPLGAFLSGGIDSGLMVALMARVRKERGDSEPVRTFTIAFDEEGKKYDESASAKAIAQYLNVEHQTIRVHGDIAGDRFPHIAQQFDEPFANPAALLHDVLCESTRNHVTVALSGDGGDEAFGGYPRYHAVRSLELYHQLTSQRLRQILMPRIAHLMPERADGLPILRRTRRFFESAGDHIGQIYRDWSTFYMPDGLEHILSEEAYSTWKKTPHSGFIDLGNTEAVMATTKPGNAPLDRACLTDISEFLPNNVLRETDRTSMRVALEVRVPYADHRILDFGLRLPVSSKVSGPLQRVTPGNRFHSKRVLRNLATRYLPKWSFSAPKQGFVAPMGTWLNGPLRDLLETSTNPRILEGRGIVSPSAIQSMRREHDEGRRDRTWHLWALVVLESWFEQRIDRLDLPPDPGTPLTVQEAPPIKR